MREGKRNQESRFPLIAPKSAISSRVSSIIALLGFRDRNSMTSSKTPSVKSYYLWGPILLILGSDFTNFSLNKMLSLLRGKESAVFGAVWGQIGIPDLEIVTPDFVFWGWSGLQVFFHIDSPYKMMYIYIIQGSTVKGMVRAPGVYEKGESNGTPNMEEPREKSRQGK